KPEAIGTGLTPRVLFPGDSGISAVSDDTAKAIHLSSAPVDEKGAILPAAERYVMKSENDLGSTFGATIASLLGNGSPDKVRPADSSQPLPSAHAAGASDNLPAVLPASLPPAMRAIVAATVEVGERAIDTTRPAAAPAPESLIANLTSIVTKAPEPKEGTGFQGVATYPGDSSKSKVSVAVLETLLADNTTVGGYVRPEAGDLDRGKGARLPVSPETAGSMVAALVESVVRSSSPDLPAVRTDVATLPAVKPEAVLPATHTIASLVSNEFTPREAFPGDSAVSRVTPETMTVLARAFQNSPSKPFVEAQPGDLAVVLPSVHTPNSAGETSLGNIVAGAVRGTQETSPIVTALTALVGNQGNQKIEAIEPAVAVPSNSDRATVVAVGSNSDRATVVAVGSSSDRANVVALDSNSDRVSISRSQDQVAFVANANQLDSRVAEIAAVSNIPVSSSYRASAFLARTSVDGAASADSLNLNTSFSNTSAIKLSSASTIDWSAGFRTDAASYMVSGKAASFESQAQVQLQANSQSQRQIERGSDLVQFSGDAVKAQPVVIDLAPLGAYQAFVSKAESVALVSTSGDAPSVKFSLGSQSVRSDVGVAVKLDSVRYIALPIVIDQGVINIRLDGQVKHYGIQGTALVGTITGSINGVTGANGTTIAQTNGTVINISIDPLAIGTRVESTTVKADAQKTDLVGTRPESTKSVQASEFIVQATRGAMTPVIAIGIVNAIKGGQSLPPGLTIENGVVTLRHNGEVFFFPGLAAALKFAQVLGLAGESQDEDEDQIAQQVSVGREKYVVEAGDTIASIASSKLGDARFGDLIITINRSEVVYRMVDGVRTPFIYPTQVLWLPSAAECRVFAKHFFNGKSLVGGVANGFVASEEYSSDCGQEPAVKTIPVVSGQPSGPLGCILDRVRFAGGRPSVDLLSPQSVGQLSQQKFYEVQDGDSLKTIAAGNSSMNSQHYWKLIAQVNGMSTDLDENGNPVMALVAGQHILMPTEREIASYRANTSLPRPVVLAASQPEMGRVQDNFSPTVITSEVEVRQYAHNCRLVVIDFPSAPSDFTLNLQVIEAGLWTTIAAYESRNGRSVKTTYGRDGVTSSMVLNLPANVVKQMAVEDFSRNWALHFGNFAPQSGIDTSGNRVSGPY
ncbi:MAG: LysM peptidoglycan-binding domain-containing protein, partial [Cyanobacteria bacterium HKST-UBA02]|nr:LysM peptidoglycan-binding domain-containing protein [Cyanobacteria bacterium HKST-UBA02]